MHKHRREENRQCVKVKLTPVLKNNLELAAKCLNLDCHACMVFLVEALLPVLQANPGFRLAPDSDVSSPKDNRRIGLSAEMLEYVAKSALDFDCSKSRYLRAVLSAGCQLLAMYFQEHQDGHMFVPGKEVFSVWVRDYIATLRNSTVH